MKVHLGQASFQKVLPFFYLLCFPWLEGVRNFDVPFVVCFLGWFICLLRRGYFHFVPCIPPYLNVLVILRLARFHHHCSQLWDTNSMKKCFLSTHHPSCIRNWWVLVHCALLHLNLNLLHKSWIYHGPCPNFCKILMNMSCESCHTCFF